MVPVKMFEVRDRHTLIAVMAALLDPGIDEGDGLNEAERWLMRRSGFRGMSYVVVTKLSDGSCDSTYDPFVWGDRTMQTAHRHMHANWETLRSGDVIDVEHILGEAPIAKMSERLDSVES